MDNKLKPASSLSSDPRFSAMVSQTIAFETGGDRSGGYTDDPDDAGGETKWGISKRAYPHLNIKALTYMDAQEIYFKDYWMPCNVQCIHSERLAFKVFDMSVLNGTVKAVKYLQKAIRALGPTIRVDGYFGPITCVSLNLVDPGTLYAKYLELFENRLRWLVRLKPRQKKYLNGWLKRLHFNYGSLNV